MALTTKADWAGDSKIPIHNQEQKLEPLNPEAEWRMITPLLHFHNTNKLKQGGQFVGTGGVPCPQPDLTLLPNLPFRSPPPRKTMYCLARHDVCRPSFVGDPSSPAGRHPAHRSKWTGHNNSGHLLNSGHLDQSDGGMARRSTSSIPCPGAKEI